MNKLLLALLVWLSSCATIPYYTAVQPTRVIATGNSSAFRSLAGSPAGNIKEGTAYLVVGTTGDGWYIVRGYGGRYLVPAAAFGARASSPSGGTTGSSYLESPGYSPAPSGTTHDTYTGPRGGHYYYNGNGNKTYVTPQSTINNNTIYTGPRGGQYYINSNGNKSYIKH